MENNQNEGWKLNPKQRSFLESKAKNLCFWSGRGAGKSLAAVLKIIRLMIQYPNNYGLLGRYNYSDLAASTEKDFFDNCPPEYIKHHNKQGRTVEFYNGSKLLFRGLKDIKKTEVRSMNLGFAVLEQAEEIGEELYDELSACLRRRVVDYDGKEIQQQMISLCNPALNWIWRRFVQEKDKRPNYELVQGSMLDNKDNLPQDFIDEQMSKPEKWKKVFVYGELDESILSERNVFPFDFIIKQEELVRQPVKKLDDILIFKEREGHIYQIGVDVSEGALDSSVVKVVDTFSGEEVASWSGKIPPDLLAHKVVRAGDYYNKARVVLEINGIGLATLTKLKELNYENIFQREEYDQHAKILLKKLGWRTTHSSKQLLVGHFTELIGLSDKDGNVCEPFVKIRDLTTVKEMQTFYYSESAVSRGMGAEVGFHDDNIMAMMLACWGIKRGSYSQEETNIVIRPSENRTNSPLRLHLVEFIDQPKSKSWLEM